MQQRVKVRSELLTDPMWYFGFAQLTNSERHTENPYENTAFIKQRSSLEI